jgi:CHAT domain-containing protein
VARRLGVRALTGPAAGEAEVRRRLAGASLVHLATHGYAYGSAEQAPSSFVALGAGEGHDGLLTVAELMTEVPPMAADLVVLSACQTGLGNLRRAEGTVGLQRALLARGARTVLVSLWSVSDRSASELMRAFYSHWLDDADRPGKAEALRRAQADVRRLPGLEAPHHWAAFQVVGAR